MCVAAKVLHAYEQHPQNLLTFHKAANSISSHTKLPFLFPLLKREREREGEMLVSSRMRDYLGNKDG